MRITINEPFTAVEGHASVTVESTPIEHELDPAKLGETPARALRDAIAAGIRGVSADAAPATLRYRAEARRALARGARWALERYRDRQPTNSTRLFNDSGALAAGLDVRQDGDAWAIVAPANRLDPPGESRSTLIARLVEIVAAIANPLGDAAVRAAIDESVRSVFGS